MTTLEILKQAALASPQDPDTLGALADYYEETGDSTLADQTRRDAVFVKEAPTFWSKREEMISFYLAVATRLRGMKHDAWIVVSDRMSTKIHVDGAVIHPRVELTRGRWWVNYKPEGGRWLSRGRKDAKVVAALLADAICEYLPEEKLRTQLRARADEVKSYREEAARTLQSNGISVSSYDADDVSRVPPWGTLDIYVFDQRFRYGLLRIPVHRIDEAMIAGIKQLADQVATLIEEFTNEHGIERH